VPHPTLSRQHGVNRPSSKAPGPGLALSPADILAEAEASRPVLQDYRPLAESLEWELGQ
jgi:hypothetical protein